MLYLSNSPVRFKTSSVLHLAHPSARKDPVFQETLKLIKSDSKQVAYIGEHFLSDQKFFQSETVILHSAPDKLFMDYLKRLKQGKYEEKVLRLKDDPKKAFFAFGNAVKLLPKTILLIPKDNPAISSAIPSISKIDISTEGLGVIDIMLDIPFDISAMGDKYTRVLQGLSKQFPVFLMDARVLYSSDGKAKFGDLYRMEKGILTKVKELPLELKDADKEALKARRIPPIRAIYAPDSDGEKKEGTLADSKSVTEIDEKHST